MIKYYIKVILRNLLKIFWLFPIDNKKIYFQSFDGKNMSCNPWYIFKYMYEKYPDYKYVWVLNLTTHEQLKNVIYVKKNTLAWIKEVLTSKFLIVNDGFPVYIGYRKKQMLLNTWHGGGAYKKVGNLFESDFNWSESLKYMAKHVDYFVSSSKKFTEVMQISNFVPHHKYIPLGMPRNDTFFNRESITFNNQKIRSKFGVSDNDFIVLYAPTYRGSTKQSYFSENIDINALKKVLKVTYSKKVIFWFRGHYFIKNNSQSIDYDMDVSEHNDMQELLCTADMLITDYSSSMWDYSFLYRPCFLFVPDLDEYVSNRGFYTDPYLWGFPICKTNDELVHAIQDFDGQRFIEAMSKHHEDLGSYEHGTATKKIVEMILDVI